MSDYGTDKVIDADAHMHEPQHLWQRYVEPKYRDQVSKVAFMHGNFMVYWVQIPIRLDSRFKGENDELRIGDFGCISSGRSDSI